jgi:hypothetical protein
MSAMTRERHVDCPNVQGVPILIAQLYETVHALHKLFPERHFTPDGHLVGNIGEVVAAYTYGLTLNDKTVNPGFDARIGDDGPTVEIKLTADRSVSVSSVPKLPKYLVVLTYHETDGFHEVYSGEFPVDLWNRKKPSKRHVKNLRLRELADEQAELKPTRRLRQKNALALLNKLFVQRPPRI